MQELLIHSVVRTIDEGFTTTRVRLKLNLKTMTFLFAELVLLTLSVCY